jgi:cytochrome P450
VEQEFTFSSNFCLKKSAYLQIPSQSVHMKKNTWGQDASTFNHRRFAQRVGIKNTGALRPFGSGTSMCPGRHFSTNVIISLTAAIVSRYDIRCTWSLPGPGTWEPWDAMTRPDRDFVVQASRNTFSEGVEWSEQIHEYELCLID